ncbi:R3h domain-containing protein 4-like [Plakobranchus ocellatus]|uniref:R3h domain-containing protein 4-like n=1 Tax=Plakobranchus ocellatus TaxID=259542 RepID=A0AAV3ZKI2_9GAST|nr:R3h domain-containing protein 4-like [Plakobranchus ocellatus]
MGLINGYDDTDQFYGPYIENYDPNHRREDENNIPSTDEESGSESQSVHNHVQTQRRVRRSKGYVSVSQENLATYGRKRGVRRARRIDNLRYLLNLEEKDEEMALTDPMSSVEPSSSLFEKLLNNPDKMEAWNRFVESSEEDQRKVLNYRGLHDIKEDVEEEDEKEEAKLEKGGAVNSEEIWVMILDKRSDHPAFSPQKCYERVDRNLRALLKRRQLPMGMLANLEREIVSFFHEFPTSVFLSDISNSYERMLLHALCQYLNLRSQSYDDDGSRKTQVENLYPGFRPPSLLLTEYLQQYQHVL